MVVFLWLCKLYFSLSENCISQILEGRRELLCKGEKKSEIEGGSWPCCALPCTKKDVFLKYCCVSNICKLYFSLSVNCISQIQKGEKNCYAREERNPRLKVEVGLAALCLAPKMHIRNCTIPKTVYCCKLILSKVVFLFRLLHEIQRTIQGE